MLINKIEISNTTDPGIFKTDFEKNLYKKISEIKKYYSNINNDENYEQSLSILSDEQKKTLSNKVKDIKKAEWDIEVPGYKVGQKEWLKSQVSRAFLPKYFPGYKKYLWIDCDAWVHDWSSVELYFKACENGKLGITQTIGPGYRIMSKAKWLFGKIAVIKSQNFKHAISSKIGIENARRLAFAPHHPNKTF